MKFIDNSNPFDCANFCDKTIGCTGTVFLFTTNRCHLKNRMETSGRNFKNLGTTDLYFRIAGPTSKKAYNLLKKIIHLHYFNYRNW